MALNYNGIEFTDICTKTHVVGPIMDPSNSDQLYNEFNFEFSAIINPAFTPSLANETNPSATTVRIRHYLTQPRGSMYYDVTSSPGQRIGPAIINLPSGRDDANGPMPDKQAFRIAYTTEGTFEVFWSCTVRIRDCGPANPVAPLSLRWEDSISWDNTWKATYKRSGTLILSSLQFNNVDWFRRNKLAVPICAGFQRISSSYMCSRDGLRCDFSFQDEQIRFAPPYPGVELEIVQSESAPFYGGMRKGAASVTMVGIQNANVVDLARWTLQILKARIYAANPINAQGNVLGTMVLETKENTKGVMSVATATYKVQPGNKREVTVSNYVPWPSSIKGLNRGTATPGTIPQPTQQGVTPAGLPYFPWVGTGTSPQTPQNPTGYAAWADPNGAIGGPADGVGLAPSIALFSALLNDPCGQAISATPAAAGPVTTIRTQVNTYNTPQAGQGGTSQTIPAQLSASLSNLIAAAYPSTTAVYDNNGLSVWDGKPGVYDYWQSLNEYITDPGVIVLPTANANGTNIAVQHSSTMTTLVKRWAARRVGAPPTIPPQQNPDSNWIFVGGSSPQLRELGTGSDNVSIAYEATGYYIYQALDSSLVTPIADIPPTLSSTVLANVASWASGINILGSGGS